MRIAWRKTDCLFTLPCLSFLMYKLGTISRVPVRPCSVEWKFTEGGRSVLRDTVILLSEWQEEKRNESSSFLGAGVPCNPFVLISDVWFPLLSFFFFFYCGAI